MVAGTFKTYRLLGLAFWQAWQMLVLCTSTILPYGLEFPYPFEPAIMVMVLTTLGYLAVTLLNRWFSPYLTKDHFLWIAALCSSLGTLAMAFLSHLPYGSLVAVLYTVAALVLSVGNALILIMWGELWSTLATGRVGRYLYVSYAFAFVLYFCIFGLPFEVRAVLVAVLPVISTLILANARQEPRRTASSLIYDIESFSKARIFISIVAVSIAFGLSQALMLTLMGTADTVPQTFLLAGVCIIALALNISLTTPQLEPLAFYRPIIPALAGGLIFLVLLPSAFAFVGGGLIILAIYCLDMLVMLVSTDIAFRTRIPVALTFGLTIFAARTGTLTGTVLFDQLLGSALWEAQLPIQLLLGCAVVVVVVGTLLFSQTDLLKLYRPRIPNAPDTQPTYQKCERVGDVCGLTARELEVLHLLATGRSIPFISKELTIANGTAKHHVSNIYRKLGVYDRQGLHDVIEQGDVGKGAL